YAWSNGGTTATLSGLVAGTYTVTITDANGCTETASAMVSEPAAIITTTNTNDVTCNASCDGAGMVNVSGGTAPYTYAWSNGEANASLTGLCAGTYVVTITDANGCMAVDSITINEPTAISTLTSTTDVTCNGNNDGTATVTVSGGSAPYTYAWSNGQSTATVVGLYPNVSYTVSITDANGCNTVDTVMVGEPQELHVIAYSTDASCFDACDGTGHAYVSGGTAPYTYSWSVPDTTALIDNLCAGSYYVIVTDANGCIAIASLLIGQPTEIMAAFTPDYILNTIQVAGSNGVSPYTYVWNDGTAGNLVSNVVSGTYSVTITDANGCAIVDSLVYDDGSGIINQFTVNVGPNPFTYTANMVMSTKKSTNITVELFDVHGNIVEHSYDGLIESNVDLQLTIDGNGMDPGLYIWRVLAEDGSATAKRVVLVK
ncbi:T9SS type A sorting domain-containing protein, partial [Putridiphycobacter roseus]